MFGSMNYGFESKGICFIATTLLIRLDRSVHNTSLYNEPLSRQYLFSRVERTVRSDLLEVEAQMISRYDLGGLSPIFTSSYATYSVRRVDKHYMRYKK